MTYPFRDKAPVRTCTKEYADYHSYKYALAADFNHHCGYTHTSDVWFGGSRTFQIDHIKVFQMQHITAQQLRGWLSRAEAGRPDRHSAFRERPPPL